MVAQTDTSEVETGDEPYKPTSYPTYKPHDRYGNPFYYPDTETPFMFGLPSNYERKITVDDSLKNYTIEEKMGDLQYRPASSMTYEEFIEWQKNAQIKNYWNQIASGGEDDALKSNSLIPRIYVSPALDRIFGGNYVDIRPNGSITLTFGGRWQRNFNPSLTKRQQRYGGFEFDQNIALNLVGKVGEKLKMNINWNTGATFEFENVVKIDYTGLDHEILQDVDAGTISFPLKGSLIQGANSLFGFKTVMKFGKLDVTSVLAQQRGKSEEQEFKNGASTKEMEIEAADYEMNKHFFLDQFFRNEYEKALSALPRIISNVNITRLEVYVRNKVQHTQGLRNFAAFADLGDPNSGTTPPNNKATKGNLYSLILNNSRIRSADNVNAELEGGSFNLTKSEDFETIRQARKLQQGVDYDFHPQLGYISLRTALQNDDVLAVAFEYTYNGRNYKVGELSEDYQNLQDNDNVYLKLLRPATVNPNLPMWDLMMKNVYSLRSSRINKENFRLSVIYKNDRTGLDNPALQEGPFKDVPLLQVMNLDNLNMNGDKQPDGNFDFVDNGTGNQFAPVTIDVNNGRIYFPVLEPFGSNLEKRFTPQAQYASLINKYVFSEMYEGTKSDALQLATKNKYFIKVAYQSATSKDLQLNGFDIQKGSVVVTVGSTTLTEGVDYEVNYLSGKVKITNEGILNSGKTIKVRYEKQDLIASQPKTFFGSRLDYKVSDDLVLGGTILRLTERPWWRTVRQGNEPSNSTVWGLDGSYSQESRVLTKLVDKLPFIQTKAPSSVAVSGEFAQLLPGHSKLIEINGEATAYLDDFEGSETPYFLGGNFSTNKKWKLASTPQMFSEAKSNDLNYGFNRAKLAWYSVDQVFYYNNSGTIPSHITEEDQASSYNRYVDQQEVFPNKFRQSVFNQLITFDLAYYPSERGPYNYDTTYLNPDGTFSNPKDRWAGITKAVDYDTDFDNANIEYIEFWLMDPFADTIWDGSFNKKNTTGGKFYLNLGNVSEDVMKDSRFFFENGMPLSSEELPDSTVWGKVPGKQYLTNGFDNSEGARAKQDLGYDGLTSTDEKKYFMDFLTALPIGLTPEARQKLEQDPSTDDFKYFLNEQYDDVELPIVGRYKEFNGFEGNSPEGTNVFGYSTLPDKEDLNSDNTISDLEAYYQYMLELNPGEMNIGSNYIVDAVESVPDGNSKFIPITWYQFRIPIRDVLPENVVGSISNFKSIRFLRMFMTDWEEPVVLRLGNFQYVSSQWRTYNDDLKGPFVGTPNHDENTLFTVSTVNIEENGDGNGNTVPYVLPNDQIRTQAYGNPNFTNALNNEQSLKLCVDNLQVDDGRAVFKNVSQDLINYKKLRLYLHAELYPESGFDPKDGEVSAFVRFGTDFTQNYYEVEVPLSITQLGATSLDRDLIWPLENEINVDFERLIALKSERDPADLEYGRIYSDKVDNQIISVRGRPDISDVRVIMLGIRNVPDDYDQNGNPIGNPKSVCIWLDELRMTGFEESSGWAALGSVKTKLADLATVNVSGRHEHMGFGSLGQNFNQRARENTTSYDITSTVLLDKFLPKKSGVNLPMYVSFDRTSIAPKFDPLNPDVLLSTTIKNLGGTTSEANEYRSQVQDITRNRSINFSNIRKQKAKDKKFSTPLDISNWSFSYAYSESNRTNINTQTNLLKNRSGSVNYTFTNKMKPISPLAKVKFLKSPYFKLIQNVNLQPLPSNVSFSADINRMYRETQYRTINNLGELTTDGFSPLYEKNISFKRQYAMKWPITKSISMDYRASVMSKVDEREGRIDKEDSDYQEKVQVILNNFKDLGRVTDFNQNVSLSYRLPINLLPLTDWMTADLKYDAGYNWIAGPVVFDEQGQASMDSLGNTIVNNNTQSINGRLDMVKLYNKVKFLKQINTPARARPTRKPVARKPVAKKETTEDADKAEEDEKGKKKKKESDGTGFNPVKATLRTMMMVRNANFSYSRNQGTNLPGYMGSPKFFGLDQKFINPGIPFVLGQQNDSIQYELAKKGLISESDLITQPMNRTDGYNLSLRATVEPFKDLKIQLSANQTNNSSFQTIFKDTTGFTGDFTELSPMTSGSYSTTFIGIKTFFQPMVDSGYGNAAYQNMIDGRGEIKRSLDSYNDNSTALGEYGLNSQEVLIPSFIKAYTGDNSRIDPRAGFKNIFKALPMPNWNLNYQGLSKLKLFAKYFSSFNIQHAYTSTYRVANYQTSLEYGNAFGNEINPVNYYRTDITNENREFISYYVVNQVMIQERMSPLVGVDMRFKKSQMNVKLSYDKSRDLSLMISNAQITEVRSDKLNFTMGWVKKNMKFPKFMWPMFNKGRPMQLKNDANFKINLSVSDNVTIQRDMAGESLATGGMYSFQFKPTIDYEYSKKINVQLYFGRTVNNPKVSTSFKNTVTEGGAKIRIAL